MKSIERTIEINAPVRTVYNQWTQFEDFPKFMDGIEKVWQLDDKRVRWKAMIGGKVKEWDAEIIEQVPDRCITWKSITGADNRGTVNFESLGPEQTRMRVHLEYNPEGLIENIGDRLGIVESSCDESLVRFKKFVEAAGQPTGAWRGEIHGHNVTPPVNRQGE